MLCLLRRFLQEIPEYALKYCAGFRSKLESYGCLQDFTDLRKKLPELECHQGGKFCND